MWYDYLKLLFVVCCPISNINGQQQAHFNNLTEKDGLSNNRVTCFFKDKTGYMWIGTESGLNLYSGNNWTIYKPSSHRKNYISGSFITDIEEDAKGNIWVCTRKGLNRINVAAGTTEVFLPDDALVNTIPNDLIWDAYPDTDSSVWIAADAKVFCRYNPVAKKFYYYDFRAYLGKNQLEMKQGYHSVFRILPRSGTELWLATTDGIFSFNKQTGAFALHASMELSKINFFYFDELLNKLYCTGNENKLYCYNPVKREMTTVVLDQNSQSGKFMPPFNTEKKLLFVPAEEGLAAINENNEIQYFLKGIAGGENNLLPGKINCVYKDRQDITWVGTTNGVSKFIPSLNKNLHLSFANNFTFDPDRTIKNFMYHQAADEWLIASWKDNKIFLADNKTGKISELQRPVSYSHDTCYAFYPANEDSAYLLSAGSLLIYSFRDKKWGKVIFPPPYNKDIFTCMVVDAAGNWWIGNKKGKLFIYTPRTKKISLLTDKRLDADFIRCLASDPKNNCVWMGTASYGLVKYNLSTAAFEITETDTKNSTALHSYIVNDIIPDGKGDIWVATFEGGIAKYKTSLPADKAFTSYDILSGLPDNNVYGVAADKNGGAWFTTINGIGHIDASGTYNGLYNQLNGLPYSKFMQAIAVLPDGKIAATTDNNFICYDPSAILAADSYQLVIDNIFVNDTVVVPKGDPGERQTFSRTQNAFTFNFSVLDFTSPGAVEYYYMLDHFDNDWVYAGKQHSVRYSKLPPGEYALKVKAKRENGGFYKQEGSFRFYIRPAFWQTAWFKMTLLFLLAGLFYWLLKKRIKVIRHDAEMKQRITESEMAALRSQMNPHFIFNCLNAIDNLIQTNQKDKATVYLSRFAKLIRSVLDSSKNNTVLFQKDFESLQLYLQMEQFRCGNRFEYELKADDELLNGDFKVPPLIVQPFAENAILHGLLNKESSDRKLKIEAEITNNNIQYTVSDNGIGRERARQLKEINRPEHQSYGIQITQERIQLYNRSDNKTGNVTITDLYENNQPCGTKVVIQLKIPDNN